MRTISFEEYLDEVVMKLASDGGMKTGRINNLVGDKGFVDLLHGVMGISSEAGELLDAYKKADQESDHSDGATVPDASVLEVLGELGDIIWFVGLASRALGVSKEIGDGVDSRAYDNSPCLAGNPIIDLFSYSGDLLSLVKAKIFYGRDINVDSATVMLRHIVASVRRMAWEMGWTLQDVIGANVSKLEKRYPGLEFSDSHANSRDTDSEFDAMKV